MCPFLTRTITLHNDINDIRTFPIGMNSFGNNDISYTSFLPCLKEKCIMFDEITQQCNYNK